MTHLLYPKVYRQYVEHEQNFSDTSVLPTPTFFYGLLEQEEIAVDIEPGKTLIIKYVATGAPHPDGKRTVFFELNGQPREVTVVDHSLDGEAVQAVQADPANPAHIGASMPGMVVTVAVQPGDPVKKGQKLLTLEAMKMETAINAERDGKIQDVLVKVGSQVDTGDLLIVLGS